MNAPDVRGPADVPDLRLHLAEMWEPGRPFDQVARASAGNPGPGSGQMIKDRSAREASNRIYSAWERQMLKRSELYWVAEDMVDLLLACASSVPGDVVVDDLPRLAPAGLVVFAKPWFGTSSTPSEEPVQVDAFCWGGIVLPPLPREGRPEASVGAAVSCYRRLPLPQGLDGSDMVTAARLVAAGGLHPGPQLHEEWVPLGRSDWPMGERLDTAPYASITAAQLASFVEDRRVLAALWTLLHQEGIARTVTRPAQRQVERRQQRAGLPRGAGDVRVVTLRPIHRTGPAEEGAADGHHVEHDHRWVVSGHWRNQPFGPGRTQRRLQWIAPHVKGPDGAPLQVPERVNAWVR